jgi:hypothetical protein
VRHILFLLTLLWQLTQCIVLAQTPETPPPVWLGRAQTETQQVVELALGYQQFDRANLYAQLGEFWWPVEEVRGREWLRKAADIVAFMPLQESVAERQLHMRAVRAVLRRVSGKDRELTLRLSEALTTLAKQPSEPDQKQAVGDIVLDAAAALADTEPELAKGLALSALRSGAKSNIFSLLVRLRAKDERVADAFFAEALTLARSSGNDELLGSLLSIAFLPEDRPNYKLARTPEPLRLQTLKAILDRILIAPRTAEEQKPYCDFVLRNVMSQLQRLTQFSPPHTSQVQQSLEICQNSFSRDSIEGRALSKAVAGEKLPDDRAELFNVPKNVADKLALARKTAEPKLRTEFLWVAAQQAAREGDPDEAIHILEAMTAEERQLAPYWDDWRGRFAARAAQKYLKQKEYGQARKVIDAVPQRLVAAAVIECLGERSSTGSAIDIGDSVVGRVGERNVKIAETERDLFVEWLNLARKRLLDAETEVSGNQSSKFLTLVSLYAAVQPIDALPVLNEAVRALNRAYTKERERQAKEKRTEVETELHSLPPQSLPSNLVKESFDGVRSALHELDSTNTKTRLHLGVLQTALGFYQEELEAKRKEEAEQAKKKKAVPAKP